MAEQAQKILVDLESFGSSADERRKKSSPSSYVDALFAPFCLSIQENQACVLLGPSGVGKSSLLRLLLEPSSAARLRVTWRKPNASDSVSIAYLSQRPTLAPWLTAAENVMLGDRLRCQRQQPGRAQRFLSQLGLEQGQGALYPAQLSGGMQQRVALARALYEDADVILMDEPFSGLDYKRRTALQDLVADFFAKRTRVLVTHDPQEAAKLGDQIYLLSGKPAGLALLADRSHATPRGEQLAQTLLETGGV